MMDEKLKQAVALGREHYEKREYDKAQRYLVISDIKNNTIWFLNRQDGKIVSRLGTMSDTGGNFFGLHMIATDSRGYIYTGEVFAGERVQRFVPVESPRGKLLDQLSRVQ